MKLSAVFAFFFALQFQASGEETFTIAANLPREGVRSGFSAGAGQAGDNNKFFDNRLGQSFIPIKTGRLVEVSWIVDIAPESEYVPLRVALHSIEDGLPGRIIATAFIEQSSLPEAEERRARQRARKFTAAAVFDSRPVLFGWKNYCFSLSSLTPNANYRITGTRVQNGGYDFGIAYDFSYDGEFRKKPECDYYFKAEAVVFNPLPYGIGGAILLLAVGFAVGYGVARERHQ
ncbi:MAG: hypothetical protein P1U86_03870 [Verrucomicrobiales bacterium]|nr:hypothetical protein [Verrucomicrobiales bacterium]